MRRVEVLISLDRYQDALLLINDLLVQSRSCGEDCNIMMGLIKYKIGDYEGGLSHCMNVSNNISYQAYLIHYKYLESSYRVDNYL